MFDLPVLFLAESLAVPSELPTVFVLPVVSALVGTVLFLMKRWSAAIERERVRLQKYDEANERKLARLEKEG